jgi:hypothetical protein
MTSVQKQIIITFIVDDDSIQLGYNNIIIWILRQLSITNY